MTNFLSLFDSYNRAARLYPALLTLFPVLIATLAWFPALITSNIGATLITIASSCGILFALSVFARSRGRSIEDGLLKKWGGWPTTIWLRHSDVNLTGPTKRRYHAALSRLVPRLRLPSAESERRNRRAADERYRSAVEWLKEQTRDSKRFPLVLKENTEYGFRRNMRGMRRYAISALLLAFAASATGLFYALSGGEAPTLAAAVQQVGPAVIGANLLILLALVGWIFFVNDSWVREAGDQYARALLASCDTLSGGRRCK
jgi:hypothetical protein